jgi:protein-disulfide isomerase
MQKKNSGLKMAVILTTIILGIIVALVIINNQSEKTTTEVSTGKVPPIEGQPILGKEDAPVTIVEFGDFKCPACNVWGEKVYPDLVKDYVDTGKVKFSYINTLFHGKESELAALAAESVWKNSPDAYWEFHKALFKEQPSNQQHDSAWVTPDKLVEIAKKIPAINTDTLKADIEKQTMIKETNKDTALVNEFKIDKTPTIMIDDVVIEDPFDYEKIKEVIEKKLEGGKK